MPLCEVVDTRFISKGMIYTNVYFIFYSVSAIMVTTRSGADNKTLLLDTTPHTLYALMAFSYLGAMLASNHSLQYVSYPTQVRANIPASK